MSRCRSNDSALKLDPAEAESSLEPTQRRSHAPRFLSVRVKCGSVVRMIGQSRRRPLFRASRMPGDQIPQVVNVVKVVNVVEAVPGSFASPPVSLSPQ